MSKAFEKEQGAVLIVSLIILLVMTVIGLAGIEVTTLEERMAGNMRDRNIAFQAAEATLRDAEDYLESVALLPAFDGTNGLYSLPGDGTKNWEEVKWDDSSKVRAFSGSGFSELSATPSYIIEDLSIVSGGDSLAVGVAGESKKFYRITARAQGLTANAVVMLQTVYKR